MSCFGVALLPVSDFAASDGGLAGVAAGGLSPAAFFSNESFVAGEFGAASIYPARFRVHGPDGGRTMDTAFVFEKE